MIDISKEEVLHLAAIAQLRVDDHEIEHITKLIRDTLNYVQRVKQAGAVTANIEKLPPMGTFNVVRKGEVCAADSEEIMNAAPAQVKGYFSVPAILETP